MGNSNSSGNTRTKNYKIYKITDTDSHSADWIRCCLDDYVPYSNGNYKHMYFEKDSNGYATVRLVGIVLGMDGQMPQGAILSEGYYIAIDTNSTQDENSNHNFSRYGVITVAKERADGSVVSFLESTGELARSIVETRERRALMIERARFERELQAWHLEPPKK